MKALYDRRIVGVLFDISELPLVDYSYTIEDGPSDLIYSLDGMTSIMWDVDLVPNDPPFVETLLTKTSELSYIELEGVKAQEYWKLT